MRCKICGKILSDTRHAYQRHLMSHKELSSDERIALLDQQFPSSCETRRYRKIKALIMKGVKVSRDDFIYVKAQDERLNAMKSRQSVRELTGKMIHGDNVYKGHNG